MNFLEFKNLPYGFYELDNDKVLFTENAKYSSVDFMKLNARQIRLPDGRGNIVFLLSNTFEHGLDILKSGTFIVPPTYRKFFFPPVKVGSFMGKRFRMNLLQKQQKRFAFVKEHFPTLQPVPTRTLAPTIMNTFVNLSDLYECVNPIALRYPIKRLYQEYFKNLKEIVDQMTPPAVVKEDETTPPNPEDNNRLWVIDVDQFRFESLDVQTYKTNPLFLLYYAYLRDKDLSGYEIDQDMMICSSKFVMKFNPSQMTRENMGEFRRALFRIMNADLEKAVTDLPPNEKEREIGETPDSDKLEQEIDKHTSLIAPDIKKDTEKVLKNSIEKKVQQKKEEREVTLPKAPVSDAPPDMESPEKKSLFQSVIPDDRPEDDSDDEYDDYSDTPDEEDEEDTAEDVTDSADDEEVKDEVNEEIQDKIIPIKDTTSSPVNSARDLKLREEQKKIMVRDSTIETILARDTSNVPIEEEDKTAQLKTANPNVKKVKFANFEKTYLSKLFHKDMVSCFDMLKDKNNPFYITGVEIEDTSTPEDVKETWHVHLTNGDKKRSTISIDVPKFYQNKYMIIGGNKYIILKQNFYNPLVKDTDDTVIMTTNFNKVTITRKATKSLSPVEKLFSFIRKTNSPLFTAGDSTKDNDRYISTLEYDEFARRIFKFETETCHIFFSRKYIESNLMDRIPHDIKGDEFFIGWENDTPILINEDSGLDQKDRSIYDIIAANLSEDQQKILQSIKAPKQSMYVEAKMAGIFVPMAIIITSWVGFEELLKHMGIKYEFMDGVKKIPTDNSRYYLRFKDGILAYEKKMFAELLLNGLNKLNLDQMEFASLNDRESVADYIKTLFGTYNGMNELYNFYEFMMDPITVDICKDLLLPTNIIDLCIHATKLLSDNKKVSKVYDYSFRTRSIEIIPAMLYSLIAAQYKAHVKSGGRLPMTLKREALISKLIQEKTVDEYSTLNPSSEMTKTHVISMKGYRGSNSEYAYDKQKRAYDPTAIGKLSMSTSPDGNVGINRYLTAEPNIRNARGYRDPVDDVNTFKDVNVFDPIELLTPGAVRQDDPVRTAIAGKQSGHVVPTVGSQASLISNGFDEAVQFHLSNDFVINAEEDGEVVDVNEETGFIMVKYKSGKHQAINLNHDIVKNSGGGFYMSNTLKPTLTKVGAKFKANAILAYHPKYFNYSPLTGLRYSMGPLAKVAFINTYNTYEDAGFITEEFGRKLETAIVYKQEATFKAGSNILEMKQIGDHVVIGDALMKFTNSFDDKEIMKYLTKLSDESDREMLEEEINNEVKARHAGKIIDIKVYTRLDPSNLSDSLGDIVQKYFDKGNKKKEYLKSFDPSDGAIHAGYLVTDNTAPLVNRYNMVKKHKGIDVLIEFYIEHGDTCGVGDKIALYSANKQVISEVCPEGYEPYSEFRPDENVDVFCSPVTISRRMTKSSEFLLATGKVLVELKRRVKSMIKFGQ